MPGLWIRLCKVAVIVLRSCGKLPVIALLTFWSVTTFVVMSYKVLQSKVFYIENGYK